jgi:predicted ATP-dependent endonuclease of OLD family
MKIKNITLQNYKKFIKEHKFSFTDSEGEVNDTTLLVGNNGTGKSSILQALVLLIASATREDFKPQNLDWSGFEFRHIQTGKLPVKIEVEVLFSEDENKTTKNYAQQLKDMGINLGRVPSSYKNLTLSLDFYEQKVLANKGLESFNQFSGYQYAKRLASLTPNKTILFEKVGNIYWYNEQRNSHNISNLLENKSIDLNDIRSLLASAYSFHLAITKGERTLKEGEFDFYQKLESLYSKAFVGRSFVGSTPRFDIFEEATAPDFFLFDGKNEYELSGMSAGERAIFPILMDFARWNINNSIIIIDEIELHLHPPLQQTLIRVLSQLGKNNQFILTSHSNSVAVLFDESENQIIRLPNE